jgi:hypothetical protein
MPVTGSAGSKTFTRQVDVYTGSDAWAQLDAAAIGVRSQDQDYEGNDIASALNVMLMKDGGNTATADIPMGTNKFTGVGNAAARTQFASAAQIADGALIYAGTSAGTDTITATLSPAITAYVAGMMIVFRAGGTNTGAATLNVNSVGAADIKKGAAGTVALAAGDITTGGIYIVVYNGTTGDFELKNPKLPDGFATTDSPQFTGIELGHASDTTITRASAGDIQVEGNRVFRVGGTDVPIADGGTGASTAADAFTALKQAASDTATGVIEIATAAEQVTGTDTALAVVSGRQHLHDSAAKAWCYSVGNSTTINKSYNITSVADTGTGNVTVNIANDFDSDDWVSVHAAEGGSNTFPQVNTGKAAGSVSLLAKDAGGNVNDPGFWDLVCFGQLA